MIDYYNRKLILEDGEEYLGSAFGYIGEKVLELVFNTSMVGHQEILSDPPTPTQAIIMTLSSHPSNYGYGHKPHGTRSPTTSVL